MGKVTLVVVGLIAAAALVSAQADAPKAEIAAGDLGQLQTAVNDSSFAEKLAS